MACGNAGGKVSCWTPRHARSVSALDTFPRENLKFDEFGALFITKPLEGSPTPAWRRESSVEGSPPSTLDPRRPVEVSGRGVCTFVCRPGACRRPFRRIPRPRSNGARGKLVPNHL